MMRTRTGCLMAVVLVMAVAGNSWAQPSAATSIIPRVLVVPGGGLLYSVTINDAGGLPVPLVPVDLVWPPASVAMTCFCPGTPVPVITAFTNPAGVATFNIAAGGCINPAVAGTGVTVFAAGLFMGIVGQVSPDFRDVGGLPVPDCRVGLADAVAMSIPLSTGIYTYCVDLNSDLRIGLADAALATPFVTRAVVCP